MGERFLRLIVMFDLPMQTSREKRDYRKFVKYLKNEGFLMMQYSVYSRIVMNRGVLKHHTLKLKQNLPSNGKVQTLVVTEKQYTNMEYLVGEPTLDEEYRTTDRVLEL